jgi:dipeptidase D
MARLLQFGEERYSLRFSDFNGGNLRNAIPREAFAIVALPATNYDAFVERTKEFANQVKAEYAITEPNLKVSVNQTELPATVLTCEAQGRLIGALIAVANGVLAMSQSVKGFVETSTNLASVKMGEGDKIIVTTSQRSSVESAKIYAMQQVEAAFIMAGAEVEHSDGYPGWAPNPNSLLLTRTIESYRRLFGKEPVVRAIHAGLECGLFLEKYPDLEMVSFGPTIRGVHSPDERLEIATVDKFWVLLRDVIKTM